MKQDPKFIRARGKAKKYMNFSKLLGGGRSSTYQKITGGLVNNARYPDLIPADKERLTEAIAKAKIEVQDVVKNGMKTLKEFEKELNRISK
jgi:hypothetical protein